MAYALALPILAFVEEGIEDLGMIPSITEYIRFNRERLQEVTDKAVTFCESARSIATKKLLEVVSSGSASEKSIEEYGDFYDSRLYTNYEAKMRIARLVLEKFVLPEIHGILLDSGSLTLVIADQLIESGLRIPVVTNNLAIAGRLREAIHYPVTILPGELDTRTQGVGGDLTVNAVLPYLRAQTKPWVELALLAANAIDPDAGLSADSPLFSEFRATILRHAPRVVIVLQGEKFLKAVNQPVMQVKEWRSILSRRRTERSLYVVCHEPACDYGCGSYARYGRCCDEMKALLPEGHLFQIRPKLEDHLTGAAG